MSENESNFKYQLIRILKFGFIFHTDKQKTKTFQIVSYLTSSLKLSWNSETQLTWMGYILTDWMNFSRDWKWTEFVCNMQIDLYIPQSYVLYLPTCARKVIHKSQLFRGKSYFLFEWVQDLHSRRFGVLKFF